MYYSELHEWIQIEKGRGKVGISKRAQKKLDMIIHVQLPIVGQRVKCGEKIAKLESTKSAVDIYSPVSGTIVKVNEVLKEDIRLINDFPEEEGYIFEITLAHPEEVKKLIPQAKYLHRENTLHMYYSESHEWIQIEKERGRVGISKRAQKELGAIIYVQLPIVGQGVKCGEEVAVLESTKSAIDIYSPVSGTIVKVNKNLKKDVALINDFPEEEGYIFEITLTHPEEVKKLIPQAKYLSRKDNT